MNSISTNATGTNPTLEPAAPRRRSRWTDALLTACGLFVITVLLMLASAFNPNVGLLGRLFDRHGVLMLGVEVGAVLVLAIIVLFVERRESRRRLAEQEAALLALARQQAAEHSSEPTGGDRFPSGPWSDRPSNS